MLTESSGEEGAGERVSVNGVLMVRGEHFSGMRV